MISLVFAVASIDSSIGFEQLHGSVKSPHKNERSSSGVCLKKGKEIKSVKKVSEKNSVSRSSSRLRPYEGRLLEEALLT